MRWYVEHEDGRRIGPLTADELRAGLADGSLQPYWAVEEPETGQRGFVGGVARPSGDGEADRPASGPPGAFPAWFWPVFASTCCCLPLGLVGLYYAVRGIAAEDGGRRAQAEELYRTSRTWTVWAVGVGIAVTLFYLWAVTQRVLTQSAPPPRPGGFRL